MTPPRMWSWHLSPFAGKARIAFAEKGVEVELLEIDPVQRPPRLRELNPTNRVPVLEVDGVAIRESTAICEWLEETHPDKPLWPSDPAHRARARGLLRWVDDELSVPFFLGFRKQAFGKDDIDPDDIVERLHGRLTRRWKVLDGLLADQPWLMGGEPCLADLAGMPLAVRMEQWAPHLAPDAGEHPRAAAWLAALRARPTADEVDRRGLVHEEED